MNKKNRTEAEIRTKFITPAIESAGWDKMTQMREEYYFTAGRIIVRGKLKSLPLPIPPLAEQRRIVAKVDQLMALVDQLEMHLAASRTTAKNLLEALVAELTTR